MSPVINRLEDSLHELVYKSIYSKLDNPSLLNKSNISMSISNNPITQKSQIMAYANASRYDGAFVILEDSDGKYQEVFALKLKHIMSFNIRHPNIILASMDEVGTDIRTCNFHVIRSTDSGYKNVWQGLANYCDHNYYPQFTFEVTANINFGDNGELTHSILKRIYNTGNYINPTNTEKISDIYVYNENNMQYQFAKRF